MPVPLPVSESAYTQTVVSLFEPSHEAVLDQTTFTNDIPGSTLFQLIAVWGMMQARRERREETRFHHIYAYSNKESCRDIEDSLQYMVKIYLRHILGCKSDHALRLHPLLCCFRVMAVEAEV